MNMSAPLSFPDCFDELLLLDLLLLFISSSRLKNCSYSFRSSSYD